MSVTPIHVAKIANTRRHLAEVLHGSGCPYPEETARAVLDEMRKLGWEAPGWTDDTVPPPATSTPAARRAAIEAAAAAVDEARRKRTAKAKEEQR